MSHMLKDGKRSEACFGISLIYDHFPEGCWPAAAMMTLKLVMTTMQLGLDSIYIFKYIFSVSSIYNRIHSYDMYKYLSYP